MYNVPGEGSVSGVEDLDAPLGSCWPSVGTPQSTALCFFALHRCCLFFFSHILKARPYTSQKIMNRFAVLV